MRAGNDFTQCRTGRGLAASRRPFGDARLPVRHCAAGAEVPSRHQTTQPKNEVLTSDRDLTKNQRRVEIMVGHAAAPPLVENGD